MENLTNNIANLNICVVNNLTKIIHNLNILPQLKNKDSNENDEDVTDTENSDDDNN